MRRSRLPFRAVNRRGQPGYSPGMQRHHLLPCQLLTIQSFSHFLDTIGRERLSFDDFRRNGMLLPATDEAAVRIGLPLHRGPHRDYNAMVMERVGQIESEWSRLRLRAPEIALDQALMRMDLLQRALRRRLLQGEQRRIRLNRLDPLGGRIDFTALDAMADQLWAGSASALEGV